MRRLGIIFLAPLLLAGCMFPQGWHWPRTAPTTASTIQTVVYVQNDVVGYQGPYLAWAATYYDSHPELALRMVDTCPAGVNCIKVRTEDLAYPNVGLTGVSIGGERHLLTSWMRLDLQVGSANTVSWGKRVLFHEFCHALGGGFRDDIHSYCNFEHRALIFSEITRVYHNDPD